MFWLVGLAMVVVLTTAEPKIKNEKTLMEMEWQNFKIKFRKVYQPENEEYRWVGKCLRGDCNH